MHSDPGLRIALDRILPRKPRADLCILWIHGGGWDKGDKDAFRPELEHFGFRGWPGAALNYRLSWEALFPACLEDVRAAAAFLAREHGRLVLAGHSAGGHLAALAALHDGTTGSKPSLPIAGVIGVSGVYDLRSGDRLPFRGCLEKLLGGPYGTGHIETAARLASPLAYAEALPVAAHGLPRFLLLHGRKDKGVPPAQTEAFSRTLRRKGVSVTSRIFPDSGHYIFHERRRAVLTSIEQFLASLSDPTGKPPPSIR